MAAPFSGLRASLDGQLARLSANERRLLTILAVAGAIGAVYFAFTYQQAAMRDHEDAMSRYADAQQVARRTSGGRLASDIEKSRNEVRDWSWQGSTIAVAQVRAQAEIADIAANNGLVNAEIKTSDRLETAGELTLAPIEITAPFSWSSLSGFMSGLSATGKGFVLEEVQVSNDRDPKVRISLKAPLVVTRASTIKVTNLKAGAPKAAALKTATPAAAAAKTTAAAEAKSTPAVTPPAQTTPAQTAPAKAPAAAAPAKAPSPPPPSAPAKDKAP